MSLDMCDTGYIELAERSEAYLLLQGRQACDWAGERSDTSLLL
jgi:hypothetical protein